MENLELKSSMHKQKPKSREALTVYVLGSEGYLGSNISFFLLANNIDVRSIDSRRVTLTEVELQKSDFVLDCSRIRTFDEDTLVKDRGNLKETLKWIQNGKCKYLRLGSILELGTNVNVSPYVEWSRNRTRIICNYAYDSNFQVLLLPNVYGGSRSKSIIDKLVDQISTTKRFALSEPLVFREFLNVRTLNELILEWVKRTETLTKQVTLLHSGWSYELDSIQKFLETCGTAKLLGKEVNYSFNSILKCADTLGEDLKHYCTS